MAENDLQIKIQKLKSIYTTPIDQRELDTVEERIRKLIIKKKLGQRAEVREIVGDAIRRIKELSYLLTWDEKATDEERKGYFAERRVHMFWLTRLDGSAAEKVLASMEKSVDYKLEL